MEQTSPESAPALRHDAWTPDIQSSFIEALAESGCVRHAAAQVGRSRTGAYRLRARPDAHAFRAAWDAALGLAYQSLREKALDRIANGLEQRTFDAEGNLVARRIVHNDRLLMFLLDHHRPPRSDSSPDDRFGQAIAALERAPAGAGIPKPAERNGYRLDLTDDELVEGVRRGEIPYIESMYRVPDLEERISALWDEPDFKFRPS